LEALKALCADTTIGLTYQHGLCLVGFAAALLAGTAYTLRGRPLIPEQDPRLGESLAFENM